MGCKSVYVPRHGGDVDVGFPECPSFRQRTSLLIRGVEAAWLATKRGIISIAGASCRKLRSNVKWAGRSRRRKPGLSSSF